MICRLVVRGALLLVILLASAPVLLRAFPLQRHGLTALFDEPGCAPPCFLGIHPGVTDITEALNDLQAHAWVKGWTPSAEQVEGLRQSSGPPILRWLWNGMQPGFIAAPQATLSFNRENGRVRSFGTLATRIPLGEILAWYGQPQTGFVEYILQDNGAFALAHVFILPSAHLTVISYTPCPLTREHLWQTPVRIEIHNTIGEYSRMSEYPDDLDRLLEMGQNRYC